MENGPIIDDLAIKRLIFHSYVSLRSGVCVCAIIDISICLSDHNLIEGWYMNII
jgi:hypothetical protein